MSSPRGPPDVDGLVLELDAAYSNSTIDSPDQVDQSQELTYVDIDTFLNYYQFIISLSVSLGTKAMWEYVDSF